MEFNCDLHIHSKYARATSPAMDFPALAVGAKQKGINVIGTGDIIHGKWLENAKNTLEVEGDRFFFEGIDFILQTEIEDSNRVHHIVFLPDFSSADSLREMISKKCKDIDADGRPKVRASSVEIAEMVFDSNGILGPAHAFTPYFSVYSKFDSIKDCYKEYFEKVHFIELGLSADTFIADYIPELSRFTFLTNSDCHSPFPFRIGREFNRIEMQEPTFCELEKAFERKGKNRVTLNVGLDERLGKYHESACNSCYTHYSFTEASALNWRCSKCNKRIKKGVLDRAIEVGGGAKAVSKSPSHRPPYLHIATLSEIIALSKGVTGVESKKVKEAWQTIVSRFGNEINVLIDVEPKKIAEIDPMVAEAISLFRQGKIGIVPGGGGKYGYLELDKEKLSVKNLDDSSEQKSLFQY